MIKVYKNGKSFYEDNKEFLLNDLYSEVFFRLDSEILIKTDKNEYAIKVSENGRTLLALLKEPYSILIMGDSKLSNILIDFLIANEYKLYDFMCRTSLGDVLLESFKSRNITYENRIRMDFMECKKSIVNSSSIVEIPNIADSEEIFVMSCNFIKDCGLNDKVSIDNIRKSIDSYRIIRVSNQIASMAKIETSTKMDKKVTEVYTKPEFREHKYAKTIVANIVNEILGSGYFATLNVDQNNPISYHIYTSLGFSKLFTQGIYFIRK